LGLRGSREHFRPGRGRFVCRRIREGLAGRIAIARKHPEAEAVNLMGWAGFLAIVPWIKALVENVAFCRQFQIRERMRLNVRAELSNIFNRTY
jgi:hypothetical protein